ncbi:hypothetical protein BC941DRAFT_175030 [Chlamydoabsidia padenii]|nr:hypothetical protein BC941DRAFT_175030 [Chlamydoabsidia padenii]
MAGSNSDNEKNDTNSSTTKSTNIPTDFASELQQFDFKDEAIDTALRKLLANVLLPKEAQQIDRAMEDFAKHYHRCNPTLTDNPDPIYAVAFSILLLHTDAHNKNVKRKMNKDTFIRRTRLIDGGDTVYSEILDVMYDNIVHSEFTYAHDQQDKSTSWFSKKSSQPNITLLHDLYPRLEQLMPGTNTFNYKYSLKSVINIANIHQSIEDAYTLRLAGVRGRQQQRQQQQQRSDGDETYTVRVCKAGILERKYDLTHGGKRAPARGWRPFGMILSGNQIMFFTDLTTFESWLDLQQQQINGNSLDSPSSPTSTKHLILHQSSFSSNTSSNASTPTTLASFSTISSAQSYPINSTSDLPMVGSSTTPISSPRSSTSTTSIITSISSASSTLHLRPVQIVSLLDAVCLYDDAYQKYPHVFRLVTGDGQQFLLRGDSAEDVDDWVQKINYMSTMKTTGVRLRPKTIHSGESDMGPHNNNRNLHPQHALPGLHYYHQHHDSSSSHQNWSKRESKAKSKVISLSEKLVEHKRMLAKDEQLRNQLMVLTPMQKATRDRMLLFADTIGKRILDQRITLQKLKCYREYIERELFFYQTTKTLERPSGSSNNGTSSSNNNDSNGGDRRDGKGNGRTTISRKLSAPLPFYSGLLQTRSTTSSPTESNTLRPPLYGMTLAPKHNPYENGQPPPMRIPHRSSSLLMSLSCGGGGGGGGGDHANDTDDDRIGSTSEPDDTLPDTDHGSSHHQNSRVSDVVRVSRQRSQSNPVPLVLQDTDGDPIDNGGGSTSPSLQVSSIKKNRDRSVSEVTTDDEDFSIVVNHGEKDSLVNHVDRIVDVN